MEAAGLVVAILGLIGLSLKILSVVLTLRDKCAGRAVECEKRFCRLERECELPAPTADE